MSSPVEYQQFRVGISQSKSLAFGCSHTWGVGVEYNEAWPYLLGAKNFGLGSASSDQVVRLAGTLIPDNQPEVVFCLWPDWSRFEFVKDNQYHQSLPTDRDRIYWMESHDDDWCKANFAKNLKIMRDICQQQGCRLVDMTLYDLIPYLDNADKWPVSKLGHHYAPQWHRWVADIFAQAVEQNLNFPLRYE